MSNSVGRRVLAPLVAVATLVAAGAIGGLLWEWLWTAPSGTAVQGSWFLDDKGLPDDFAATGLYVLLSVGLSVPVGLVFGVLAGRREVVVLAALLAGSLLAAWVMLRVGHLLGPPDPAALAKDAADYTKIPGDLHVTGRSAYLGWPAGALSGLLVGLAAFRRRPSRLEGLESPTSG